MSFARFLPVTVSVASPGADGQEIQCDLTQGIGHPVDMTLIILGQADQGVLDRTAILGDGIAQGLGTQAQTGRSGKGGDSRKAGPDGKVGSPSRV